MDPRLSSFARVAHFTHWVRVAKDTAIFLNVPPSCHSATHTRTLEPSDIVPNFVSNPIVLFSAVFGRLFGIDRFDVGRRRSDHRGAWRRWSGRTSHWPSGWASHWPSGRASHRPSGQAHEPARSAGRRWPDSHWARWTWRPPSAHRGAEPGIFHPHVRRRRSH